MFVADYTLNDVKIPVEVGMRLDGDRVIVYSLEGKPFCRYTMGGPEPVDWTVTTWDRLENIRLKEDDYEDITFEVSYEGGEPFVRTVTHKDYSSDSDDDIPY